MLPQEGRGDVRADRVLEDAADDAAGGTRWRCLLDASRKPAGAWDVLCDGGLRATVEGRGEGSADAATWILRFHADAATLGAHLEEHGAMPLPPYIEANDVATPVDHRVRYQTVFACNPGAIAASGSS